MSVLRNVTLVGVVGSIFMVSGCGDATGTDVPSSVAARVNSGELAVRDVRAFLGEAEDPDGAMGSVVLERLIGRELLVQQALRRRLDSDPEVARRVEASRREILVRAYIEREFGDLSPTDEEVDSFYLEHPGLFAERNVYALRELTVRMPSEQFDVLRNVVDKAGSLDEIGNWLHEQGYEVQVADAVRAAEQLPSESLSGLSGMSAGQIALGRSVSGAIVVQLADVERQPLGLEVARPMIESYLFNRNMSDAIGQEVARLRSSARIVYGEGFDPGRRVDVSSISSEVAYQPDAHIEEGALRAALERGVAGLK